CGLGGQAWASLQYLIGLRELGHEVFYLEDCGETSWVYNWDKQEWTAELDYPAAYVRDCLEPFGFGNDWIYRTNEGSLGAPLKSFLDFCSTSDLLIVRNLPLWVWREEYNRPTRRAFIDGDPAFTQISIANGDTGLTSAIARCEKRFTVGYRYGAPDCSIPDAGGPWLPTKHPVVLSQWPFVNNDATHFTSVVRWQGFKEVTFKGVTYGQRDKQFPKFLEIPRRTTQKFCMAIMGINPKELTKFGWETAPGEIISKTPFAYRDFIQNSRGEFSVPKNGYVQARSGWFSDRSVCYLASGRPLLMEDTGLADWLPVGTGLVTFTNPDEAVAGVEKINSNYEQHCRAAREIAETHFASKRVLPEFLNIAMT
ncbi:MAG: glycosyltransferase family 1 protein, partial [Verrucomicrobiota bacterium]